MVMKINKIKLFRKISLKRLKIKAVNLLKRI